MHRRVVAVQLVTSSLLPAVVPYKAMQSQSEELDGIVAVVCAMKVHVQSYLVQKHGCCALWSLTYKNQCPLLGLHWDALLK